MSNMFWAFNECLLIASIHRSSVLNVTTCCFICGRIIQHKRFTFFQVKSWVSLREDSQRPRRPALHPRQCWALAVTIRVVLLTDTRAEVPSGPFPGAPRLAAPPPVQSNPFLSLGMQRAERTSHSRAGGSGWKMETYSVEKDGQGLRVRALTLLEWKAKG